MNIKSLKILITAIPFLFAACSKGPNPDGSSAVPNVTVSLNVNINTNSAFTPLQTVGGSVYVVGGYRGLLLYRLSTSTIMAFDRACTYDISNSSSYVNAQNNGTAICLYCGSTYSLTSGNVNTGPSTMGLKTYTVSFNSSTGALIVTN